MRYQRTVLVLVSVLLAGAAFANEYCDGYKDGYAAGYSQVTGAPPTPMSPLCPTKKPRSPEEKRSDYQIGYDRGLKDGVRDGSH